MRTWNLNEIPTPGGSVSPVVLETADEARAVLIGLDPGQELGQHQVKERMWLVVVDGQVQIECGGQRVDGGPGLLATFAPDERHSVSSAGGARVLLVLAPWPGEGHYRGEEKSL